jgi:hypothetical protein
MVTITSNMLIFRRIPARRCRASHCDLVGQCPVTPSLKGPPSAPVMDLPANRDLTKGLYALWQPFGYLVVKILHKVS